MHSRTYGAEMLLCGINACETTLCMQEMISCVEACAYAFNDCFMLADSESLRAADTVYSVFMVVTVFD